MLNKWISVKDRLPEAGKDVLVYDPKNGDEKMYVDQIFIGENGDSFWDYGGFIFRTYWMPLPEPPGE